MCVPIFMQIQKFRGKEASLEKSGQTKEHKFH